VFRANICESQCVLRHTLKTGKPIVNKAIYIVNADGKKVPISISTALLKDEKGRVLGGVETFRDLSLVEELRREIRGGHAFADIVGRNHAMQLLFDTLPTIAESNSTVLIEGESGTGKELFARAIHDLSPRRKKPFVAISCGALPDTLLESELFGYKAGAFTDARKDKPGRFALAEGGTLFLDEIGDVSPALQVRLLRALQERVYEPLGGTDPVKANVRVVTATHRSLSDLVDAGTFRSDLYYRVNVVRIRIPPLRERRDDIPLLIDNSVRRFSALHGKDISGVAPDVLALLMRHDYPGNVRELENIMEHAFVLCPGGLIRRRHLPDTLQGDALTRRGAAGDLAEAERKLILEALKQTNGNRTAAARKLGIHRTTLFRKMRRLSEE
jgi:transcriptional regulator with PAS, ATPase and Fis domain